MKTLIQSCLVFLVVTVSWFALHHWLFSHEVIAQKELVQKITERRCVDEELNRMARDSELHKFEEILARGQHYLEEKVPKTAEIGP
ncbi:MAG: hypothetical protein JKY15_05030, partial [Deltaproteobacteria bacterium]|nr:hypothetical protein [Deltaproteobacteria bacterium]